MKMFDRTFFVIFAIPISLLFFSGCVASDSFTEKEAKTIVDQLLIFRSNDEDISQQLEELKKWQTLFDKYAARMRTNPSEQTIRNYLFLVFVANAKAMSHTRELISEEIVEIFSNQSAVILEVLGKSTFLIESTCSSIASSFTMLESQQAVDTERKKFLTNYESKISSALSRNNQAEVCLSKIRS